MKVISCRYIPKIRRTSSHLFELDDAGGVPLAGRWILLTSFVCAAEASYTQKGPTADLQPDSSAPMRFHVTFT